MWQIIGQTRAVSLLQHSLESGNLAHAYLFIGPSHVGKMTLAVHLAQALNCEAAERPCLECASCEKIKAGSHSDVQVIGLTRNEDTGEAMLISIGQIEDLQHDANLPPFEGKHKVFIIDPAELLSLPAANRLLKTLEEPADKVTFILLTINDRLLPTTVISRCQRLELPPLSVAEEAKALMDRLGIEPERARLLAGLSHGCPGWALAAAGDDSLLQQRDQELSRMLDTIKADYVERFAYVSRLAARFTQNRGAVYDILDLWLDYWRDLMLVKLDHHDMITNIDRKDELVEMAGGYRLNQMKDFIKSISSTAEQLRQNVNTRLALEVLMLDIPSKEGGGVENLNNRISVKYG
ncbi:MAG: DNA polymerase III subunit [Dehalococcoidales bacterium]|nr:DNA polymerase III subunit [Dehalococcoidales bacterium]